jgi:hypothetical protein
MGSCLPAVSNNFGFTFGTRMAITLSVEYKDHLLEHQSGVPAHWEKIPCNRLLGLSWKWHQNYLMSPLYLIRLRRVFLSSYAVLYVGWQRSIMANRLLNSLFLVAGHYSLAQNTPWTWVSRVESFSATALGLERPDDSEESSQ